MKREENGALLSYHKRVEHSSLLCKENGTLLFIMKRDRNTPLYYEIVQNSTDHQEERKRAK